MTVVAKITHSSGFVTGLEMQKLDLILGFRCSFIPSCAGKYSVKVYELDDIGYTFNNINSTFPGRVIAGPMEIEVSRNYGMESKNPITPIITLEENGEKYWGLTSDKYSGRVSSYLLEN
jgi:hypothetical protein